MQPHSLLNTVPFKISHPLLGWLCPTQEYVHLKQPAWQHTGYCKVLESWGIADRKQPVPLGDAQDWIFFTAPAFCMALQHARATAGEKVSSQDDRRASACGYMMPHL